MVQIYPYVVRTEGHLSPDLWSEGYFLHPENSLFWGENWLLPGQNWLSSRNYRHFMGKCSVSQLSTAVPYAQIVQYVPLVRGSTVVQDNPHCCVSPRTEDYSGDSRIRC